MKMNKILNWVLGLSVCALFPSCIGEDANPYGNEAAPTVSISTSSSSFVMDAASLQFELSHFIHKDVTVLLDVEGIERNAIDLPESFVIPAGAVKKSLPITIDEDETTVGSKTVVISIKEAENANIGDKQVSIPLTVVDIAYVEVSTEGLDEETSQAVLTFTLSKKVTKDVTLAIVYDSKDDELKAFPAAKVNFDSAVTIPAGEKVGTLVVGIDKAGVAEDQYKLHFTIGDFSANAKAGTNPDVSFIVNVGFQPTLASTSDIYFQYANGYWYVNYDNLHDYYFIWSEPLDFGDATDKDYVKAAMYRCRDWIQQEANRTAWKSFWDYYVNNGYSAYVWHSVPQLTSEKTGYVGWPMIMTNGGVIEDLGEVSYSDGKYHSFLVGFTADLEVLETYQYSLLTI